MAPRWAITGLGSISALGCTPERVVERLSGSRSSLTTRTVDGRVTPLGAIDDEGEAALSKIVAGESRYASVDRSVLLAIHAARAATQQAGWHSLENVGINVGSSRGATQSFEGYHRGYLEHPERRVPTLSSPSTTLGNLATWVAHDLGIDGVALSHSITCSTSLHAFTNAMAWLKAGMAERFVVGGTEAPLTGFTVAQMRALRLYASPDADGLPCRPMQRDPQSNTMVLGEGAAVMCLERAPDPDFSAKTGDPNAQAKTLAYVDAVGWATESIRHQTSLSSDAACIYAAMKRALDARESDDPIDCVIVHAPGTRKGDPAELSAIRRLFGDQMPLVVSHKWRIGHTLGAAGAFGVELALDLLARQKLVDFPYPNIVDNDTRKIRTVMVNAVGFGGNAACVVLSSVR